MEELYMIIKTVKILAEMKVTNEMVTERCYEMVTDGYNDVESAVNRMRTYRHPQHYIVVSYWC